MKKVTGVVFSRAFKRFNSFKNEKLIYPQSVLADKKNLQEKVNTSLLQHPLERGKAFLKLESYDKALETFYNLQEPIAKAFLGTCLLKIGNSDFAKKTFEDVIKSDTENGLQCVVTALLFYNDPSFDKMAQEYSLQSDTMKEWVDKAFSNNIEIETYRILTILKPDDWRVWCKYGTLLYNQEKLVDDALDALDKAISLTSHYLPVYQKAIILNENDRGEEAISYYQKVIDINDRSNTVSLFHLAEACNSFSRYQDTLVYLNKALEMDPENQYASGLRGRILMQLDRWDEAYRDLEKSYKLNPQDENAMYWYGIALHENKKLQSSLDMLTKVLEKNPNHASAWLQKGICVYKIYQEKFDSLPYTKSADLLKQSVVCYEKCIDVDPQYARGYFMLSLVHLSVGNRTKAREYCEFGLKVNPKDPSGQAIFAQLELDEEK